ncbi:MAG: type 1 glutamine amidotransferase [Cyanobacteria bacterium J06606_4]
MNILVIQSTELDPIGVLGQHLQAQGAQLVTWLVEKQPAPPDGDYDGLIILGGPMNAHEDDAFPHLKQTVDLIQQFHLENKPIMGVCLGAQLIARAFGSRVYAHRVPELGFSSVWPIKPAVEADTEPQQEPWLTTCPPNLKIMQWHFDTFDLPQQATLLMTNDVCKNQAFRIGQTVYGFQFHFEVTPEIVLSWLQMKSAWIEANYPQLEQQLKEQVALYSEQSAEFARQVAQAWLNLSAQPKEHSKTHRDLIGTSLE